MSCTYRAPKVESRTTKCLPKIFISSCLYLSYKFRSSTATDKQLSVSLNITSVYLSAFVDFANIFIRYRSKQSISELSLIVTEIVSTTIFSYKEIILAERKSQ